MLASLGPFLKQKYELLMQVMQTFAYKSVYQMIGWGLQLYITVAQLSLFVVLLTTKYTIVGGDMYFPSNTFIHCNLHCKFNCTRTLIILL